MLDERARRLRGDLCELDEMRPWGLLDDGRRYQPVALEIEGELYFYDEPGDRDALAAKVEKLEAEAERLSDRAWELELAACHFEDGAAAHAAHRGALRRQLRGRVRMSRAGRRRRTTRTIRTRGGDGGDPDPSPSAAPFWPGGAS